MHFAYSPRTEALRQQVRQFLDSHIVPRIGAWHAEVAAGQFPVSFMADLKALARAEGLWNLFLPALQADEPGTALSNLEYAPLAEIMGRVSWASEVFNCNAPDTGNMELLHLFASPEQRQRWLQTFAGRRDTLGLCHDRARCTVLRCQQYPDPDPP